MNEYTITLTLDDETCRWYAQNDEIPIILEDENIDSLINKVKSAVPEILELNNKPFENINLIFENKAELVLA